MFIIPKDVIHYIQDDGNLTYFTSCLQVRWSWGDEFIYGIVGGGGGGRSIPNAQEKHYTFTPIDVWRSVWRCMHAKLAPLTPHPLARDRHYRSASGQRGNALGQATFLPHFSSKMWNASQFCVSSLRSGHANLLCIVPILVYVPPKRVRIHSHSFGAIWSLQHFASYSEIHSYIVKAHAYSFRSPSTHSSIYSSK